MLGSCTKPALDEGLVLGKLGQSLGHYKYTLDVITCGEITLNNNV